MKIWFFRAAFALSAILPVFIGKAQSTVVYDIVLSGDRVIDLTDSKKLKTKTELIYAAQNLC